MKIVIFVENNSNGGMDSFLSNLINYWPHSEDELHLVANSDHPGWINLQSSITADCKFISHNIRNAAFVVDHLFRWLPSPIRRLLRPFFKIFLYSYQLKNLSSLLMKIDGDRLLSVNGAYPGGETCRIASIAWRKLGKTPSIHNIHNFAIPPRFFFGWYENWVDTQLEKSVHSFIGVSKCCSDSLRLRPKLQESKKISFIYNGVCEPDTNENSIIDLRKSLNINESPLCLMLANYEPRKGHAFLFKSFKRVSENLPDATLVVCGDGTSEEKIKVRKILHKIAPNSKIHLLDFIAGGSSLISQADVLLVASQEMESFGLTVAEAMMRGVPVVSTATGGLVEVVGIDGESGFSVEPTDTERFSYCISELISNTPLREEMSKKGKLRVVEMFSVERMASEYAKLVRQG